jgi:hypothetical protein
MHATSKPINGTGLRKFAGFRISADHDDLGIPFQTGGSMVESYDPLELPPPDEWLDTEESERLRLVEDYHRRAGIRLPNVRLHSTFHVIVENQVAIGDEIPVGRTLVRLMNEGIDRHEAIHAIASVLSEHVFDVATGVPQHADPNAAYFAALERLTVASWRQR